MRPGNLEKIIPQRAPSLPFKLSVRRPAESTVFRLKILKFALAKNAAASGSSREKQNTCRNRRQEILNFS